MSQQTSTVVAYKGNFEILSNRIVGLFEAHKLSCFLSGLKDEIRLPVRMLVPKTLTEAYGLAKIQEYLLSCKKGFRGVVDNGRPSILGLPKFEGKVESRIKLLLHRLTSSQMEERRKLELCTIVMKSGKVVIGARELSCSCWKNYLWKLSKGLMGCNWLR